MLCDRTLVMKSSTLMSRRRTYSEVRQLSTFLDRFEYLSLKGQVGEDTFGFERHMNQRFYRSREWKQTRSKVIARDLGCDLGVEGFEIHGKILVHHINPITPEDIRHSEELLFDLENLITTTHNTHNAIHYGDESLLTKLPETRRPGDTRLW